MPSSPPPSKPFASAGPWSPPDAARLAPWSVAADRLLQAPKNRRRTPDVDSATPPPVAAQLDGPPSSLSSGALALPLPSADGARARRTLSAFLLFVLGACASVLVLARQAHGGPGTRAIGRTDVAPAEPGRAERTELATTDAPGADAPGAETPAAPDDAELAADEAAVADAEARADEQQDPEPPAADATGATE